MFVSGLFSLLLFVVVQESQGSKSLSVTNCSHHDDGVKASSVFESVFWLETSHFATLNFELMAKVFQESYHEFIQDNTDLYCDDRQLSSVEILARPPSDKDSPLLLTTTIHAKGTTCMGCNNVEHQQGLFELPKECCDGRDTQTNHADETVEEDLQEQFLEYYYKKAMAKELQEDDEAKFAHYELSSTRRLNPACPLGDGREAHHVVSTTFTQDWSVVLLNEIVSDEREIQKLGVILVELFNAWAYQNGDDRVACQVTPPSTSTLDYTRVYTVELLCDGCSDGETFDSLTSPPVRPTQACGLFPPNYPRYPLFANWFASYVNTWLANDTRVPVDGIFSITAGGETGFDLKSGQRITSLIELEFTVDDTSEVELNEQFGLNFIGIYNGLNQESCEPTGFKLLALIDYQGRNDGSEVRRMLENGGDKQRRRLGSGSYTYSSGSSTRNRRIYQQSGRRELTEKEIDNDHAKSHRQLQFDPTVCEVCLAEDPKYRKPTIAEVKQVINGNITITQDEDEPEGCDEEPAVYNTSGFVCLDPGELNENQRIAVGVALKEALNELYAENCSRGNPVVLVIIISQVDYDDRRRGLTEPLDEGLCPGHRWNYVATTRCGTSNGCPSRIMAEPAHILPSRRQLTESTASIGAYTDSCICTTDNPTFELPTPEDVLDRFNLKLENVEAISLEEDDDETYQVPCGASTESCNIVFDVTFSDEFDESTTDISGTFQFTFEDLQTCDPLNRTLDGEINAISFNFSASQFTIIFECDGCSSLELLSFFDGEDTIFVPCNETDLPSCEQGPYRAATLQEFIDSWNSNGEEAPGFPAISNMQQISFAECILLTRR